MPLHKRTRRRRQRAPDAVPTPAARLGDKPRLGMSPPPGLATLRQDVRQDVYAVYGVPSALHGSGTSARESYRQMLRGTIVPLSKLVVEELAVKLDTPTLALDFRELRAADIAGSGSSLRRTHKRWHEPGGGGGSNRVGMKCRSISGHDGRRRQRAQRMRSRRLRL